VINSVIGPNQSKFIEGRQILDGCLVANEVIGMAAFEKHKLLPFKANFEKGFDSVNWNFLMDVMRQIGFRAKWRNWISLYLSLATISVMINGSHSKEFKVEHGLRLAKSMLMGVRVSACDVEAMASSIRCSHDSLPSIYLGLPVGKRMWLCEGWNGFKESQRGLYWVKWKNIMLDPKFGGQGVGCLQEKNPRILAKILGVVSGPVQNVWFMSGSVWSGPVRDEPKFPPGFTPDNNDQEKNVEENMKDTTKRVQSLSNKLNDRCSNRGFSSQRSMNSHSQKSKLNERRDLWDYLRTFIDRWKGDTVIMGDFNEIKFKIWSVLLLMKRSKGLFGIVAPTNHLGQMDFPLNFTNDNNIQTLLSVLRCFYLASGLKINLHKSKLMGIGVSSNGVAAAASLIGCSILTDPFNYLGVKVGSNMSRITSWDDVISKVPIGVLNHLESIRRNFFYGVDGSNRKLAWIGWNMVLTSKKNGGEVALKVLYKRLYALEMCKSISVAEKMSHPSLSHSFRRMPRGSQEFSVQSSRISIDDTIVPKAEIPTRWLKVVPIKKSIALWEFSSKACSLI
nr:cysteine-rich receptor-like protein kinase [Tanacetum cinerariifolium]